MSCRPLRSTGLYLRRRSENKRDKSQSQPTEEEAIRDQGYRQSSLRLLSLLGFVERFGQVGIFLQYFKHGIAAHLPAPGFALFP